MGVLRRMRKDAGLSLEDVHRLAGIDEPHLSRLERGLKQPTIKTLRTLGKVYGYPVWEIVALLEEERIQNEAFSETGRAEVTLTA